jgi:DNA-binding transcriptional MerR regulator
MYTMKQVQEKLSMSYETLKYYCREGLVPNVKRDENNHRLFDDRDIAWLEGMQCLRRCGMSLADMKLYMNYCLEGESTIPERKAMLRATKRDLCEQMTVLRESIAYIDSKQRFYDEILAGRTPYESNLIQVGQKKEDVLGEVGSGTVISDTVISSEGVSQASLSR